jgi:hypothetical protein
LLLSLSALVLAAQNGAPTGNVSTRLGATDPAGNPSNFTLFREQQVFVMSPGTKANPWQTAVASFDANLTPTATVSNLPWSSSIPFDQVDIQAVAGHIVHPDKDYIAIVQRSESDPTKLAVRFRDGTGETSLGNLPGRIPGWTNFLRVPKATWIGSMTPKATTMTRLWRPGRRKLILMAGTVLQTSSCRTWRC